MFINVCVFYLLERSVFIKCLLFCRCLYWLNWIYLLIDWLKKVVWYVMDCLNCIFILGIVKDGGDMVMKKGSYEVGGNNIVRVLVVSIFFFKLG